MGGVNSLNTFNSLNTLNTSNSLKTFNSLNSISLNADAIYLVPFIENNKFIEFYFIEFYCNISGSIEFIGN